MRYLLAVLTSVYLASVGTVPASAGAGKLGKVIYIKVIGDESAAPSDVWEKDLDTGANRIIVSQKALPKGFETRAERALVSPTGRYLYVSECTGVVTKSGRRQYGSAFSFTGDEPKTARWIGSAHWCLDRKTGKWTRITDGASIGIADVSWSPTRDVLLIQHQGMKTRLYNPATRKSSLLPKEESVTWTAKGDGFVSRIEGRKTCSIGIRPLGGKRKPLFNWPSLWTIAQSPRGTFAIYDGKALALVDSKGKRLARLPIPVPDHGSFNASFSFSPGGTRLVIHTSHSYGEPAFNQDERIWLVDLSTKEATGLDNLHGQFGFSDEDKVRLFNLAGWLDERSVVIVEETVPGISYGSPGSKRSYALYIRDITARAKPKPVFDTGTGCIALSWSPAGASSPAANKK